MGRVIVPVPGSRQLACSSPHTARQLTTDVGAGACGRGGSFEVIRRVWSRLHRATYSVMNVEVVEPPACILWGRGV